MNRITSYNVCYTKLLRAIDAAQAALLMNIRGQIMVFHPIGTGRIKIFTVPGVGCAVFPVEIMFVTAVVVPADIIAVVAAQALTISRHLEDMALHPALFPGKVATGTSGAMHNGGILIPTCIGMTTQAPAAEHVIC